VLALQDRQDVGTYHYVDNLALSIAHCGRVLTQVWPVIYDQAQVLRIIGEDDDPAFVHVDPGQKTGYAERKDLNGKKVISINPGVGKYDVRAVVGPAFQTRQAETAAELGEFINGNPQMLSLLGDVLVKARNYPDAEKLAKRFQLMLPPQIQQAEQQEEDQQQLPPQIMAALNQAQQEIQGLQQALQESQSGMQAKQVDAQVKMAQIASSERLDALKQQGAMAIESMRDDQKRDGEELRAWLAIVVKRMDEMQASMAMAQTTAQMQTAPENEQGTPEAAKTDVSLMLAEALGRIGAPRRKRLAIQAPSGETYQGMVEDEE
jgi:hypothetical protein